MMKATKFYARYCNDIIGDAFPSVDNAVYSGWSKDSGNMLTC